MSKKHKNTKDTSDRRAELVTNKNVTTLLSFISSKTSKAVADETHLDSMEEQMSKADKTEFPSAYVLLFIMLLLAVVLTWLVPAGEYEHTLQNGELLALPNTYHKVDTIIKMPWDVFPAIVKGLISKAEIVVMIFFIGSAMYIVDTTSSLRILFASWAKKLAGKEGIVVFFAMLLMAIGGVTGVFGNIVPVLIPIGIYLAQVMGFDKTLGFFIIFLGAFSGYNVGFLNAGILGTAQKIVGLPLFSGLVVRSLVFVVNFLLNFAFVYTYMKQIKNDPKKSLNYGNSSEGRHMGLGEEDSEVKLQLTLKHKIFLIIIATTFIAVILGTLTLNWHMADMSAVFLAVAIIISLLDNNGLNGTVTAFLEGCKKMISAALIVGFSSAFVIILREAKILDTIVFYLTEPIADMSSLLAANSMLGANMIMSCLMTSGSSLATTMMPVLAPIAEKTAVSSQLAVQAFQFGDGFTNCVLPTVGTLMSGLALAGISYKTYLKKYLPLFIIQVVLSFIAISVLALVAWA